MKHKEKAKLYCLKWGEATQKPTTILITQSCQAASNLCCEIRAPFSYTMLWSCSSHYGGLLLRIAHTLRLKFTEQGGERGVRASEDNIIKRQTVTVSLQLLLQPCVRLFQSVLWEITGHIKYIYMYNNKELQTGAKNNFCVFMFWEHESESLPSNSKVTSNMWWRWLYVKYFNMYFE